MIISAGRCGLDRITKLFMAPYNAKVWATRPEWMVSHWVAERGAMSSHAAGLALGATRSATLTMRSR